MAAVPNRGLLEAPPPKPNDGVDEDVAEADEKGPTEPEPATNGAADGFKVDVVDSAAAVAAGASG